MSPTFVSCLAMTVTPGIALLKETEENTAPIGQAHVHKTIQESGNAFRIIAFFHIYFCYLRLSFEKKSSAYHSLKVSRF